MNLDPFSFDMGNDFDRKTEYVLNRLKEKDSEIEKLKGKDGEKDIEICAMIRARIMTEGSPEGINQLTGALANMMTVIEKKL